MFTEHSVTYEIPGGKQVITREVFTADGRYLGSEYTTEKVYRGYDGWRETQSCTETREFHTKAEAQAWMDAMFIAWELAHVGKRVAAGNECT